MTKQQIIQQSIKDRDQIETQSLSDFRKLSRQIRISVLFDVRSGKDPTTALRSEDEALTTALTTTMAASHLTAIGLTKDIYRAKGINLKTDQDQLALSASGALRAAGRRSKASGLIPSLRELYKPRATKQIAIVQDAIEQVVAAAVRETIAQGLPTAQAIASVRSAMTNAGLSFDQPWAYETMVRTETNLAYSAGRQHFNNDPAVSEILHSMEYSAVGDARTRPNHLDYDGTIAPVDDPIWQSITPPNGYNCRCTLIEVFDDEAPSQPTDTSKLPAPDEGFSFNPADIFKA